MFILSLNDEDIIQNIGVFDNEEQILEFLDSVPNIKESYGTYVIEKSTLSPFLNIEWGEAVIPLTSYMFSGEIDPYFTWQKLSHLPTHQGVTEGQTMIDNYLYENKEVESQVKLRESLKLSLKSYFEKIGKEVDFGGHGSQDGEYLLVDGDFYTHIDPMTIATWAENNNIDDLLKDIL